MPTLEQFSRRLWGLRRLRARVSEVATRKEFWADSYAGPPLVNRTSQKAHIVMLDEAHEWHELTVYPDIDPDFIRLVCSCHISTHDAEAIGSTCYICKGVIES